MPQHRIVGSFGGQLVEQADRLQDRLLSDVHAAAIVRDGLLLSGFRLRPGGGLLRRRRETFVQHCGITRTVLFCRRSLAATSSCSAVAGGGGVRAPCEQQSGKEETESHDPPEPSLRQGGRLRREPSTHLEIHHNRIAEGGRRPSAAAEIVGPTGGTVVPERKRTVVANIDSFPTIFWREIGPSQLSEAISIVERRRPLSCAIGRHVRWRWNLRLRSACPKKGGVLLFRRTALMFAGDPSRPLFSPGHSNRREHRAVPSCASPRGRAGCPVPASFGGVDSPSFSCDRGGAGRQALH